MMKKLGTLLLAAIMMLSVLTGCGGSNNDAAAEVKDVDLTAFYNELAPNYEWAEGMVDLEGEMLDMYYPGLSELAPKQLVAKAPMMSAVVNEFVFVQCESEEDAAKAEKIFQDRITYQVGDETTPGGAWYPESIEGWKKAEVVREGNYVALVASSADQAAIVEAFKANFQ